MEYQPRIPREGINVSKRHPLAELVTLVAGISFAVVAIAAAAFILVEAVVRWIPPSFESRVFGGLWSADVGSDADDPRLEAAGALLGRLASHWEENPYQLHLAIMEEESPNAFAVPGGTIYVTRGLLDSVIEACTDRPLIRVEPELLDALRLGAYQLLRTRIPAHAAVDTTVELVRGDAGTRAAGFVNAILRKVGERDEQAWVERLAPPADEDPVGHAAMAHAHPRWIAQAFADALRAPEELDAALAADDA